MDRADGHAPQLAVRDRSGEVRAETLDSGPIHVVCADADRREATRLATDLERLEDRLSVSVEVEGRAVLERLESTAVECVVCGPELAAVSGLELLEAVRESRPSLPFVFVTRGDDETFVNEALTYGETEFFRAQDGGGLEVLGNRVRTAAARYRTRTHVDELERGRTLQGRLSRRLLRTAIDAELEAVVRDESVIVDAVHEAFEEYDALVRIELARYDGRRDALSRLGPNAPSRVGSSDEDVWLLERLRAVPDSTVFAEAIRSGRPQIVCGADSLGAAARHLPDGGECLTVHAVELRSDQYLLLAAVTESCGVDERDLFEGIATEIAHAIHTTDLQSALGRFRNAVEHAGHVVLITDETGTIEYVNPAFEAVTGYDSEEAIGKTPAMLSSGEHDEAFYADLWGMIHAGKVWRGEVINQRADGSQYVIDQTIAPIENVYGEVVGYVAVNQNVTDVKTYERELEKQNDRLAQYGRMVAHDLRNPLTLLDASVEGIESALHVAPETPVGEIESEMRRECRTVADLAEYMDRLVEGLLSMAEQGQFVLDAEETALEPIARSAWREVGTASARLVVEDARTEADPERLRELLSNLFRNAIEHAGTDVTVRLGPLEAGDGFYVEDDGPGIPADERERVLERGYTTTADGTGYGLAIVTRIAEAHEWEVVVTERDSGGARFEFRR